MVEIERPTVLFERSSETEIENWKQPSCMAKLFAAEVTFLVFLTERKTRIDAFQNNSIKHTFASTHTHTHHGVRAGLGWPVVTRLTNRGKKTPPFRQHSSFPTKHSLSVPHPTNCVHVRAWTGYVHHSQRWRS